MTDLEVAPGQLRMFPLAGIGAAQADAFHSAIDSSVETLRARGIDEVELLVYLGAALAVELAMRAVDVKPGPLIAALRLLRDVHRDLVPVRAEGIDIGDEQWIAGLTGSGAMGDAAHA